MPTTEEMTVDEIGEAPRYAASPTRLRIRHYYRMVLFMTYREVQLNDATAKGLEIQQLHILVLVVALQETWFVQPNLHHFCDANFSCCNQLAIACPISSGESS